MTYLFSWKKLRAGRNDYGNRHALVCNQCDATVFKGGHAGRPVDERYFFHLATEVANKHLENVHQANAVFEK